MRALNDRCGVVLATDRELATGWFQHDFLSPDVRRVTAPGGVGWIVGNPPYNEAEAHIRHALEVVKPCEGVAFLLRLNLLGSSSRAALWRAHPPAEIHVLVPRPSFTGKGTDNTEYGFFVWLAQGAPRTELHHLVWK